MQKLKIALSIPGVSYPDSYFVLPVKDNIEDEKSEHQKVKNILIVSNNGGSFGTLYQLLLRRDVLNKYLDWIFEDNHLIIMNDGLQPEGMESEYLWFIYSLQQKAQRDGGDVHFILGNREVTNLQSPWRYAHPKYADMRPDSKSPVTALYHGNDVVWKWLSKKNIIEKIGTLLFVPSGISAAVNQLRTTIPKINRFVRRHYLDGCEPRFTGSHVELLLNSTEGPLSYKGYFDGTSTQDQIKRTLCLFGVKLIVTACEDAAPGIYCNGKVINIAGDRESMGAAGLLIKGNNFYQLDHLGHRRRLEV